MSIETINSFHKMANIGDDEMTEITDAIMVFDREGDNKLAVRDIIGCLRALGTLV